MSLFSSHSRHYLGVDFGTQSIKAVELKIVKGKPHLMNYGWVNVTQKKEVPDAYDNDYAELLRVALKALIKQMDPDTKKAVVAIPSFNGLVMIVDFPRMSEKDIASAIKFESRKYIPASLDEVNVAWEVLKEDEKDKDKPTMKVLLIAAPKSEVQYYDGLFEDVDVSIDFLELESFSLARSVIGNTQGRFMIADIGAKTTNLVLVEDGVVHVSRSIDVGGVDMTTAIMKSMNVSRERAVALKESGENLFTGATKVSFPSVNFITNEIERILSTQQSDAIESLVLCGGAANLVGLPEHMASLTKLTVTIGNPLSRVVYDEKSAGRIKELGLSFAVAIGLAMRGIEDGGNK
jgi:type IV pilus assembly protein PilM